MQSSAPARATAGATARATAGATARILVLPGSPALFSLLTGEAAADNAQMLVAIDELLRAHLTQSGAGEPAADVHIVASQDSRWYTAHRGSLRAWGLNAHVDADALPAGQGHHLGEIIARLLLERVGVEPSRITEVRGDIGQPSPDAVTVVVLDGSAGLDARAPLALLPAGAEVHTWCRRVLQGQQTGALADASWLTAGGIVEPTLWLELAALVCAATTNAVATQSVATTEVRAKVTKEQIVGGVGRFAAALELTCGNDAEQGVGHHD